MLFNSYEFLFLFLPVVMGLYYLGVALQKPAAAQLALLFGSLFFYAYWDVRYLPLLLGSIAFNYGMGRQLLRGAGKGWLALGLTFNLLLLFYFKYLTFALGVLGMPLAVPSTVLPLGISFFTFTQIAFLVDAYRRQVEQLSPASYGLFVTVFPHLIAGPILHHRDMMRQFHNPATYRWNVENCSEGLFLLAIGMTKKVLVADSLVPLVASVFDVPEMMPSFLDAWGAALAYSLQLYFDFSGYSDMALGLGLFFNVRLPINFNSPYKAQSIIDFWRRWHMTLSAFLRDYLYIPLGGSRAGESRRLLNLFLTMLLGGLWHGAGWTFVLWGVLQGLYLVINHLVRGKWHFPASLSWPLTLVAVIVGWVIFRATDLTQAERLLQGMLGMNGFLLPQKLGLWISQVFHAESVMAWTGQTVITNRHWRWIEVLLVVVLFFPNSQELKQRLRFGRLTGAIAGMVLALCVLNFNRVSEFLYFQF